GAGGSLAPGAAFQTPLVIRGRPRRSWMVSSWVGRPAAAAARAARPRALRPAEGPAAPPPPPAPARGGHPRPQRPPLVEPEDVGRPEQLPAVPVHPPRRADADPGQLARRHLGVLGRGLDNSGDLGPPRPLPP